MKGFKTGDLVRAHVTKGKKIGHYVGRVAVRSSGNFNITTAQNTVQGISSRYCLMVQRADGYNYEFAPEGAPPRLSWIDRQSNLKTRFPRLPNLEIL